MPKVSMDAKIDLDESSADTTFSSAVSDSGIDVKPDLRGFESSGDPVLPPRHPTHSTSPTNRMITRSSKQVEGMRLRRCD